MRRVRILAGQAANRLSTLGIAFLGHRARVDDAQIGRFVVAGVLVANPQQTLTHVLRLVLIDLAAERAGLESWSRHRPDLFRFRLDRRRHRTGAAGDEIVPAERVNLIALQFRMFQRRGQTDGAPARIDFLRDLEPFSTGCPNTVRIMSIDVIVRMIIVVPQNHLVPRLTLGLGLCALRCRTVSTDSSSTTAIRSRSVKADALRYSLSEYAQESLHGIRALRTCVAWTGQSLRPRHGVPPASRCSQWQCRGIGLPRIVRLVTGYYIVAK